MRITVRSEDFHKEIETTKGGYSLLKILRDADVFLDAPCMGAGICGKCTVGIDGRVQKACTVYPYRDMDVYIPRLTERMQTVAVTPVGREDGSLVDSLGVAIDIGTTTIAFALVDIDTFRVLDVHTRVNAQKSYGADVISRIQAANDGELRSLRRLILSDIDMGMEDLTLQKVERIAISGNTTMIHLLMGYSCEGLGKYPFTPVEKAPETTHLFTDTTDFIFPSASAFVGGDIIAGIYETNLHQAEDYCLFLDLGTNAEIVLGNREHIYVTSAAAGPAFEGANISIGSPSVEGAIYSVERKKSGFELFTIGDVRPIGICGSGAIEAVYEFYRAGRIDENGVMRDEDIENGGIALTEHLKFTMEDVANILIAKSAVYSGIQVLIRKAGIRAEDIKTLYIAGGFGYYLDVGKAAGIGLIPAALRDRCETVGNTALKGAIKALKKDFSQEEVMGIAKRCMEVSLAESPDFEKLFIEHMKLPTGE